MVEQINRKPENEMFPLFTALRARNMGYSDKENKVQFFVSGDKGVNKVVVKYDEGSDLYNVEFWNINLNREDPSKQIDQQNGVYFDQLTDTIWRGVVIC